MKYNLTSSIDLSDIERSAIDEKVDRLSRHVFPPFTMDMMFDRNKHHKSGDIITCKINIEMHGRVFHAEREAGSVQDALDEVISALKNELERDHDKRKDIHEA